MTIEQVVDGIGGVVPTTRNDRRVLVVMNPSSRQRDMDVIASMLKQRHNLQAEFVYRFRAPGSAPVNSEHGVESAAPFVGR